MNPSNSSNVTGIPLEPWMRNRNAQRRYENARVRESEIRQRLCYECGRIVNGDDTAFQHHVVAHEAAFICYQIYHFERGKILPRKYHAPLVPKKEQVIEEVVEKPAQKRLQSKERKPRKIRNSGIISKLPKQKVFRPFITQGQVFEPKLSSDSDEESTRTVTEDEEDAVDEVQLDSDDSDDEMSNEEEQMDDEYQPLSQGTSSRGRPRKPKHY